MASLLKNIASQNFTFCLVLASNGAAAVGASVSGFVTKDNGAQAGAGGTVTGLGNGQYNYAPTQAETNATDVGFLMTATGAIPVNIDFHTDTGLLTIDANGNASITSNVKKNTASSGFEFVMTSSATGAPQTGLTITSTRSIDGAAFASTTNSATEISQGWYTINLSAADTNGNHIALRFSSAGANDTNVTLVTQP